MSGPLEIEHAATRCTSCNEHPCAGKILCTLYPPPEGDGWYEVKQFADVCGVKCVLWRRLSLALAKVDPFKDDGFDPEIGF